MTGKHVHNLDADVRYLMGEFDSDKDGSVSRTEFHAALLRFARRIFPLLEPPSWPSLCLGRPGLSQTILVILKPYAQGLEAKGLESCRLMCALPSLSYLRKHDPKA